MPPSDSRELIERFAEIVAERERQDAKWGGPDHDDEHKEWDWCAFITEHNTKAEDALGNHDLAWWRRRMIEVAALAIAAVESLDRRAALASSLTPQREGAE